MESMGTGSARHALVRPVPASYNQCTRTSRVTIDVALARRQHVEYCRVLRSLGLRLIWIRGDDALPDSCFVEDTAVVFGDTAVICNLRVSSRANEVIEVARVLAELKDAYRITPPATIDGGDVLTIEDRVFVGISARTNLHAVTQLKTILDDRAWDVVPVKVRKVLHLKSACTYLGKGVVILSSGSFDSTILAGLEKIVVPKGEEYAADCLVVNGTVLMAKGYAGARKLVENAGFRVRELDIGEFRKGDGALTCLSILL